MKGYEFLEVPEEAAEKNPSIDLREGFKWRVLLFTDTWKVVQRGDLVVRSKEWGQNVGIIKNDWKEDLLERLTTEL